MTVDENVKIKGSQLSAITDVKGLRKEWGKSSWADHHLVERILPYL